MPKISPRIVVRFTNIFNYCCMLRFSVTNIFDLGIDPRRVSSLRRRVLQTWTFFLWFLFDEGEDGVLASLLGS